MKQMFPEISECDEERLLHSLILLLYRLSIPIVLESVALVTACLVVDIHSPVRYIQWIAYAQAFLSLALYWILLEVTPELSSAQVCTPSRCT